MTVRGEAPRSPESKRDFRIYRVLQRQKVKDILTAESQTKEEQSPEWTRFSPSKRPYLFRLTVLCGHLSPHFLRGSLCKFPRMLRLNSQGSNAVYPVLPCT